MPAEVPERVAVVETQQQHYAADMQEMRREIAALRQQMERFIAGAQPVLDAFKDQQEAKTRMFNAVAMKVMEWGVVGLLTWAAAHFYANPPGQQHAVVEQQDRKH